VEGHGNNPLQKVIAIVPARYDSVRLEGKLLLPLAGKPLILHTLERVARSRSVEKVFVATDDERISTVVEAAGFQCLMTSGEHKSGTDRIAEAAKRLPATSIIVNVQADEPLVDSATIDSAVESMISDPNVDMATCSEEITVIADVLDPNIVKAVVNGQGFAVYFSRSPVPFPRDAVNKYGTIEKALESAPDLIKGFRKHIGIYVYRSEFLIKFAAAPRTVMEKTEMLEQLRALELGAKIKVVDVPMGSHGVDTITDYERVRAVMEVENVG